MNPSWYAITLSEAVGIVVSGLVAYLALILFVRANGLRSFAKMSSHDFAVTVAVGSMLASVTLSKQVTLAQGVLGLGALLLLQHLLSRWRLAGADWPDNQPLLLMRRGEVLRENLRAVKLTEADLYAKLRAANVHRLAEVQAVVMETSGDVSVLAGGGEVEARLLEHVRETPH